MTAVVCDVAVVGAGLAGLICARMLTEAGLSVQVFDKSKGTGGRMATRRGEEMSFDHGAQYFTVRHPAFARQLIEWEQQGLVAPWTSPVVALHEGKVTPSPSQIRYVGIPGMSGLCRGLSQTLALNPGHRLIQLERTDGRWWLHFDVGSHVLADAVVMAIPAPLALPLLHRRTPLAAQLARVAMDPCWALMLLPQRKLGLDFGGAFVDDPRINWIACNSSKPGRHGLEAWVIHATPEWSRTHLDAAPDAVAQLLHAAFETAIGRRVTPLLLKPHRWRHAKTSVALGVDYLLDHEARLGICGDWCRGSRVEDAFLSGRQVAAQLLAAHTSLMQGVAAGVRAGVNLATPLRGSSAN